MALMPKMTPKAQTYPTIAQVKGLKKFMINQPFFGKWSFIINTNLESGSFCSPKGRKPF